METMRLEGRRTRIESKPSIGLLAGLLTGAQVLLLRSREKQQETRELQVLETIALGQKNQLLLVRCAGERFLVSTGSDGVSSIVPVSGPAQPGLASAAQARTR